MRIVQFVRYSYESFKLIGRASEVPTELRLVRTPRLAGGRAAP
jgi:hypothetical protein